MMIQKQFSLSPRRRGFHLITEEIIQECPELKDYKKGLMQVFLLHTSASLSINENADPTVRKDFEMWFNETVAEHNPGFQHTSEGPDDMPAHIKSSLLGCSVLIPVSNGKLALGMWQGIYLGEHRNHGGSRKVIVTLWGEKY